jgi:(2Fe-2S) ferredoxin
MKKPERVILVCCSFRQGSDAKGKCHKKGGPNLLPLLHEGLDDRGLGNILISSTGCLNACDDGPVMAIYPEGYWYGGVDEDRLEEILDALESGKPLTDYLLAPAGAGSTREEGT